MTQGEYRQVRYEQQSNGLWYAIKTPRPDRLQAARCMNRWEKEVWQQWHWVYGWRHLCPVLDADSQGNWLVMPRVVQDVTEQEIGAYELQLAKDFKCVPPVESKPNDWGRYEGRLVAVDYGYACDTEESMAQERATLAQWDPRKG